MAFLTQSNFPRLWLLFQYIVGGTRDKRKLALRYYSGQKKVLEIGCSVGNVSEVFKRCDNIDFTGIDIDESALKYARKRFRDLDNYRFRNISLSELAGTGEKFDFVLFANILHHVDDDTALSLLTDVQHLLAEHAVLVIMEPEKARSDYNLIYRLYYLLERGEFRRHAHELSDLIDSSGLMIKTSEDVSASPDSLPFIKAGNITLIQAVSPH